ncbi:MULTISPECIES: helix-turn-helix domain-containing protein [Halorubrum]|uniref:Bacterio-opsin activator HTH domain protein n=1 Tax=Halorubrum hochstenium ATCC 700873 TaxID=1227481 RepID=M0EY81_9EURY|nr:MULTISPECIES: helix-turn-helix domain-containing protein [Halorubrum]ELZ52680.1 Bacterio-opsin activator HTH domain protein [Halorubrum hochstenium ATCC 700873]
MAQARLRVDIPDGPWVGDVSREFPDARFQVLTATPDDGAGFALVRVTADDTDPILDAIADHDTITHSSVMAEDDGMITVQVEALVPLLQTVAKRAGVPIEMPVEIRDVGADFEVEYVQKRVNPGGSLTERQREVLFEAVDRGYYDVPRETTLTEVADHVGIAKSTCSEVLQRVERTIVREFVDDLPRRPVGFESPEDDGIERIQ